MLKWTVHKTGGGGCGGGGGGGRSPSQCGSGGPCYSIRRAAAKLRHRPRRSRLQDKENCDEDQENYRASPRKQDSIYMCLDSMPVALRDVSNYQSVPRTPENQAKPQVRASLGYTPAQPRPRLKTPCSSCSPHRKELLRDRQAGVKRGRRQTPTHLLGTNSGKGFGESPGSLGCESVSPVRKKQPCSDFRHKGLGGILDQTPSTSERSSPDLPRIEYSPCPLRTTQSLIALRQRMTDTFPLIAQGISLDNPLYYALKQSPTPSPVDLINKEIPTTHKKDDSETPVHSREFMSNFIKNLNLGSNESDEIKLIPRQQTILPSDKFQSCWLRKEKAKTCDVSPLARRLAWLRLNNVDKKIQEKNPESVDVDRFLSPTQLVQNFLNPNNKSFTDVSMTNAFLQRTKVDNIPQSKNHKMSCDLKTCGAKDLNDFETNQNNKSNQRVGNIVVGSSVINILNTNHDRENCKNALGNTTTEKSDRIVTNLDISINNVDGACFNKPDSGRQLSTALKRRGVIFNERTFELNTPPASDSDEKKTINSSCCTSIDLDKPSTLKRQKVVRRRRLRSVSDENLPLCKRVANRHPISYLTLPKGLPSPFEIKADDCIEETPKSTRSKSASHLQLTSPKKVTFGCLYDIEYSDNGDKPSFLGLTLPKGIPSPPSPSEEEIPGVRPLDFDRTTQTGNKRKSEVTSVSDCSEETWDSHRHYLKTPKLSENYLNDVSFAESSRTKSPASPKTNDEEDNDDDFSSLASSIVTDSPLRQSRSRRCLSFASPNKHTRSRKRIFGRGDLEVSLKCSDNILIIRVFRGRNLGRPGAEPCNAYVKVCLIPSNSDRQFHRTCVRRYSNNPRFDHQFLLQLCDDDWERRLLISAWHRDRARRRSEFLGCMSFAVKHVAKKEISGTFRLLSQQCGRIQHVPITSTSADRTDVMANQSESSVEECVSIEESDVAPTPDPAHEKRTSVSKKEVDKTTNEDSIFLKHLELDPPVENDQAKGNQLKGSKGGRTPFTTTKRLSRQPGTSFGFSIAWTHPPRIERVEAGLPADQAGLRPGDYVIFVDKTNVVTLPEEEILKLIKSCGNHLMLEVYRKVSANGTIGRSSLISTIGLPVVPRQYTSTTCSAVTGATTTTASVPADLTKRRLHLPQVTFTSEGSPENSAEGRRQSVYQLLHLEQQYALCLQFGIARFLLPLSERRDVISPQDHSVLFQNAQELLRLTEDILEMMIQEEGDRFGTSVGRIYLRKMTAMMNGYRRYCSGLKKADCLLVEKTRNSAFMRLITEPPVPRRRPDLTTFVHKPLEHFRDILKLLQTIQNSTSSKDEDYPAISRVCHEFQTAYRDITVESGLMEPEVEGRPLLSLQDLESRLVFTRCKPFVLSSPGRQWIFGGDLSRVEGRSVRPFWALLFTDLLLFAKVSRDRVLFVTEEPLSLQSVSQALFSIRKKATEFRLILNGTPPGTDSPATGGCGHLPDLPLTRTPRKGRGRRTIALRAPTAELKAVWQNLIQRQIIYLNTARGGTPASSPLDSPDPLTADSVATLDSLCLKRQVVSQLQTGLDELIEHRCRQLGKTGSNKGSALHLAQWMKGQLGSGSTAGPATPDTEPEPEVWSPATLRRHRDQLDGRGGMNRFGPRNMSRCEDLDVSDHERSTSRCTEHSTDADDSQNTVRSTSANSERPLAVCRQCHKTCLVSNNNLNVDSTNQRDVNANRTCANFSSLDDSGWVPLTESSPLLSPTDPFNPVPHISILPPSPPMGTTPANNNFWEDAALSSAVDNKITTKEVSRGGSMEEVEDESEGEGDIEEPPYRSLSPCGLRRYGTVSSLERLDPDDSDGDETGKEQEDLPADGVVGGQLESYSQSLRGWTIRAGYFVAEKMALFERLGEDSRATSFFDRYLRSLPDQDVFSHELAATSTALAGEDECETSGGTSGEDIWGTPTSGDSELTSPTLEQCPDCPGLGTAADDAREALMMDELLGSVTLIPMMSSAARRDGFPQRRRLEPLPEDEEDTTESSSSPDISECTKSYSTDQGNRSDSCVTRVRASTSPSSPGFFTRLRLRRSHSAESRTNKGSKILQFLRSTKSEDNTPSTSSGSRLMRLFSKDSTDDIPTSIPAPLVPPKQNEKTLERRFWKQIRRRRTTHSESLSPKSATLPAS